MHSSSLQHHPQNVNSEHGNDQNSSHSFWALPYSLSRSILTSPLSYYALYIDKWDEAQKALVINSRFLQCQLINEEGTIA